MRNPSSEVAVPSLTVFSVKTLALFCVLLLPLLCTPSSARTIRVPVDYPTIQGAINASVNGDEVVVSPGTYPGNISISGKNIVLRSTDPRSTPVVAATILDANRSGSVITFAGSESPSCILSGFTITRGYAYRGGGIAGNGTHATIQYNTITNNEARVLEWFSRMARGGGIYDCDGLIWRNTITGNTATYGAQGGGLDSCDGTIQNNTISHNATVVGGGLSECQGLIQSNRILDNTSWDPGGGINQCNGVIQNNLICGNLARGNGGGIHHFPLCGFAVLHTRPFLKLSSG